MKRFIAILLLLPLLLTSATSCQREAAPQQCGIFIEEDGSNKYAEATRAEAKSTFVSLITDYAAEAGGTNRLQERIETLAARLENVFASEGIPETDYIAFIRAVQEKESVYAHLLAALKDGIPEEDMPQAREAVRLLFTYYGSAVLDGILRGVLEVKLDDEIEQNLRYVSKYSSMPALEERYARLAKEAEADKATLEGIDKETFSAAAKLLALSFGVVTLWGEDGVKAERFTDAELRTLVTALNFSVELDTAEWMFLLKEAGAAGMLKDFYVAVTKNHDGEKFAGLMNDIFALVAALQNGMDEQTVKALWENRGENALDLLSSVMTPEAKTLFEKIAAVRFRGSDYTLFLSTSGAKAKLGEENHTPNEFYTCAPEEKEAVLRGIVRGIFYD